MSLVAVTAKVVGLISRVVSMEVAMRVVVDPLLCESNALCVGLAPSVFELDEDDTLAVLDERPEEDLRADVQAAAAACPKRAISVVDG